MFFGRLDLVKNQCPECKGSGQDPKKKKRLCPVCEGRKTVEVCPICNKVYSQGKDAAGNYRIDKEDMCKCYEGCNM